MFSNIQETIYNDPVKEMTKQINNGKFSNYADRNKVFKLNNKNHSETIDSLSLSDVTNTNLSAISEITPSMGKYAPVNFDNNYLSESEVNPSDYFNSPRCNYTINHLSKCNRCYDRFKTLINSKVSKKLDEMLLDNKLRQLQNNVVQPFQNTNPIYSDSWKDSLVIVVGAILAIFIIFLIVKTIKF